MTVAVRPMFIHIPKSGGTTIRRAFNGTERAGRIHLCGHKSARDVRHDHPKWWATSTYKFAIVRDPWDRAVSWYYFHGWPHEMRPKMQGFPAPGTKESRERFDSWLRTCGPQTKTSWFHPAKMLLDDDGTLMVDDVFQMEKMGKAISGIANRIGGDVPPMMHENINPAKTRFQHYSQLYTDSSREFVKLFSLWEIETFGYEFKHE